MQHNFKLHHITIYYTWIDSIVNGSNEKGTKGKEIWNAMGETVQAHSLKSVVMR